MWKHGDVWSWLLLIDRGLNFTEKYSIIQFWETKSGGDGKVDTPVPIPNTAVKHFSADGSTLCESRTLPG